MGRQACQPAFTLGLHRETPEHRGRKTTNPGHQTWEDKHLPQPPAQKTKQGTRRPEEAKPSNSWGKNPSRGQERAQPSGKSKHQQDRTEGLTTCQAYLSRPARRHHSKNQPEPAPPLTTRTGNNSQRRRKSLAPKENTSQERPKQENETQTARREAELKQTNKGSSRKHHKGAQLNKLESPCSTEQREGSTTKSQLRNKPAQGERPPRSNSGAPNRANPKLPAEHIGCSPTQQEPQQLKH